MSEKFIVIDKNGRYFSDNLHGFQIFFADRAAAHEFEDYNEAEKERKLCNGQVVVVGNSAEKESD